MNKIASIIIASIGLASLYANPLFAQDDKLTKEVQVVRPYEPTISDAFKINELPLVADTISVSPSFSYNLTMRPVAINFNVNPIPPARMVAEPLTRISRGYAKLGFGNYSSPLAEIYYSNERDEEYSYGVWLKHKSSFGNIKLDNSAKVDANYSRTNLSAFGKRIFSKSVLLGNLSYNHFGYNLYGFDTLAIAQPIPDSPENQAQRNFSIDLKYHSTHIDSTHVNYSASTKFNHFSDKFGVQQNTFYLGTNADKFFRIEKIGGSLEFTHHINNEKLSPDDNTIITFSPWVGLFGEQWRAKAGVRATFDNNELGTNSHFYPIGHLSYDIISNYVIPYFEFGGHLEDNRYGKILNENPWATPGLNVLNSSHKFVLKGGVKGNMSPRIAYNISASYSLVDSAYFFVNSFSQSNDFFTSTFDVVYDNIRKKEFLGELTFAPTSSIKIFAMAQFTSYTMQDISQPWHKPNLLSKATLWYNLQDKILLKTSIYYEGKRHVKLLNGSTTEIDGIFDVNLGLEYRYNKRASAFININNLTANRYHLWYLYPAQRFQLMLGVTYAL